MWSAGCSTGQEPYSLAMLICDALAYYYLRNPSAFEMPSPKPIVPPPWKVEVLASDMSYAGLLTAQQGIYSDSQLETVDYTSRLRYFDKLADKYSVKPALKSLIQFDFHNLKTDFLPRRNDIIFCRNVMIYFDEPEQKRLIEKFYHCMNPGGYLFVGHAESLFGLSTKFRMIHMNNATAYQRIEGERVNFFSDERAAELRELFFESAQDQLQELNEAGILLETDPADSDALARVRRAMHTLKGDAAACGFRQLSELAHDIEDLLTPALVTERGEVVAEIVLSAADSFHAMLGAHRGNLQPPDITELRAHIRSLAQSPKSVSGSQPSHSRHEWTGKDKQQILEALRDNMPVYHLVLGIDPGLQMPAAALQLVRAALEKCGTVVAQSPAGGVPLQTLPAVHAALSSSHPPEWIRARCQVPSIVSDISIEPLKLTEDEPRDALQVLLEAETAAESMASLNSENGHTESPAEGTPGASGAPGGMLGSTEAWLRVETGRIDTVMNLIGELIIGKSMLHRAINEFDQRFPKDALRNRLGDVLSFQSRVLGELQKSVMKIRMVPVEQLFRRLPRIVRDVAKARKKEIAIEMAGQNTDLDKSVLDALAEPMAHLIRNAADHGIETPEDRLTQGKSSRGTIRLDAYHQGNQVVIEVSRRRARHQSREADAEGSGSRNRVLRRNQIDVPR